MVESQELKIEKLEKELKLKNEQSQQDSTKGTERMVSMAELEQYEKKISQLEKENFIKIEQLE